MKTKNKYFVPIDINQVAHVSKEGIAHVGNLIHSIDYDAPEGTSIFAALHGTVVYVKDDSNVGGDDPKFEADANYIEILHDDNEISEYEHIKQGSSKVTIGDVVTAGQIIAEVGNTGWSECPHLHFMVYEKGSDYETREIEWIKIR